MLVREVEVEVVRSVGTLLRRLIRGGLGTAGIESKMINSNMVRKIMATLVDSNTTATV